MEYYRCSLCRCQLLAFYNLCISVDVLYMLPLVVCVVWPGYLLELLSVEGGFLLGTPILIWIVANTALVLGMSLPSSTHGLAAIVSCNGCTLRNCEYRKACGLCCLCYLLQHSALRRQAIVLFLQLFIQCKRLRHVS